MVLWILLFLNHSHIFVTGRITAFALQLSSSIHMQSGCDRSRFKIDNCMLAPLFSAGLDMTFIHCMLYIIAT